MNIEDRFNRIIDALSPADTIEQFSQAAVAVFELFASMKEALDDLIKRANDKIASVKDGEPGPKGDPGRDGKTPSHEELEAIILPLIPDPIPGPTGPQGAQGRAGNDGSPDTAEQVVAKVNDPDAPLIHMSRVEGLEDALKARAKSGSSGPTAIAIPRGDVRMYDLSDSLDGVTKTFSLPTFWRVIDVKLSSVPVLRLTTDYTVDGTLMKITFTSQIDAASALSSGQSLIIIYAEP